MNVTRTTPPVIRPVAKAAPVEAAKPAEAAKPVAKPPVVKAQAQGALQTTTKILGAAAGAVGGGGLGGMVGWGIWFFKNAGGVALSANVIGIGVLVGAAVCGFVGWKNGAFWGGAIEDTLGLGKK